jgi:NitT/TauT family transport system substrate-binding protein
MKKKIFVILLVCAAFTSVHAKGSSEKVVPEDEYTFTIGYGTTGGLCAAPFYIAIENGYFDEENLKWDKYNLEPGTAMQLLTMGQIDATYNMLGTLIQPLANGLDVKIPLALHTGCVKVLVRPDSPIKTPADLKGKKIGTDALASSSTMVPKRYLAELGYKVSGDNADVEFVVYPSSELGLALEKGLVDAIGISDPKATILQNEGKARVIINTATDSYLKNEFCCVTPIRSATVKNYPNLCAKFVRAIQKGAKFVQDNPDRTAQILSEKNYVAGDPAVNVKILKTYSYVASVSQARVAIEKNATDLQRIGLVDKDVNIKDLINKSFVALPGVPDLLN